MKKPFTINPLMQLILLIVVLGGLGSALYGQTGSAPEQVAPANGSTGITGAIANSFVIKWDSVPNAAYYQWVISDNHLCFKGCAGDTRQSNTNATSAISYNFPPNKWYYWIVRAILTNGDTTWSSPIWSFRTESSDTENSYITISLDAPADKINIGIEWPMQPEVRELTYEVVTETGQKIINNEVIKLKQDPAIKQEWVSISVTALQAGTYYFIFSTERKDQTVKKVIIL